MFVSQPYLTTDEESGGGPWGQVWTERPRAGVSAYFAARNAGSNPARLNHSKEEVMEIKSLRGWADHYGRARSSFCAAWYRLGSPGEVTTRGVMLTKTQASAVNKEIKPRGRPKK